MQSPEIPFSGGGSVNIHPQNMDSWVRQEDRVPLSLAISLYNKPTEYLDGFQLIPGSYRTRLAAWFNTNTGETIIGFRGTSVGRLGGHLDIQDDKVSLKIYYLFFTIFHPHTQFIKYFTPIRIQNIITYKII
jgi:hypothetical protein